MRTEPLRSRGLRLRSWILTSCLAVAAVAPSAGTPMDGSRFGGFVAVPEMQVPGGIVAALRVERERLADLPRASEAIEELEREVRSRWSEVRELEPLTISRWDLDETAGVELPSTLGDLEGRVIGHDESTDTWYVELRGPKLPAKLPIVTRYLTFYAGIRFSAGNEPAIESPSVTIRREVRE